MKRIASGGQTGADREGLDWAIENDIPHGEGELEYPGNDEMERQVTD